MKGIKPNPMKILNPINLDMARGNTIGNQNLHPDLYQNDLPTNYPSLRD